jgi:tetratricopeptide (TPR) repeat protein
MGEKRNRMCPLGILKSQLAKRLSVLLHVFVLALWLLNSPILANGQTPSQSPSNSESRSAAAEAAKNAGKAEQAIGLYRKALAEDPRWAKGWESLGILLADRKEYVQAREAFQNLVKIQPRSGDAWALLGICEFRMGEYDLAVEHMEKARTFEFANDTLFRLVYYYTAAVMVLRGDFDTALVRLLLLSREGVASDELMEAYGLASLRVRALPGGEEPALRPVVMEVGTLVARSRDMAVIDGRKAFEKLIAKDPRLPGLNYTYGKYLASHALYAEACESFKAELQNSPNDPMTRLQIATIRAQYLNDPSGGLELAREAVQSAPELFAGHLVLGRILLKLGETDRAVAELETATKQAPDSVMVHTTLLNAYNKANRKDDAAREQEILKRLQRFEASLKGQGSDAVSEKGRPANREARDLDVQ